MSILTSRLHTGFSKAINAILIRVATDYKLNSDSLVKRYGNTGSMVKLNAGEKGEIEAKRSLYDNKNSNLVSVFNSAGASGGIELINYTTGEFYTSPSDIYKSPPGCKSDVGIHLKTSGATFHASIKSTHGAPASMVNHTHRNASVFRPGGALHSHLDNLDSVVDEYREKGPLDVKFKDLHIFDDPIIKQSMVATISYFTFHGTGKGNSKFPADSIIYYNGKDIKFQSYMSENAKNQYVESLFDKYVMSIRSKAMPNTLVEQHRRWVIGETRGALHIRI